MSAAKLTIAVEPFESGKVVYLPMGAGTSKKKARGRVLLRIDITNNEAATVEVKSVTISFPGSNVASETKAIDKKIKVGKSLGWSFAEAGDDILFDLPGPSSIQLDFSCVGFSPATVVTLPLAPHASPVAGGAYLFPAHADDLKVGEFWSVSGATHTMGGQSFAYDMGVRGVDHDAGVYSDNLPGTSGKQNSDRRVWGKPVRAMADGVVLEAVNDCPNNPAPLTWTDKADLDAKKKKQKDDFWGDVLHGGAGNHLYVQHGDEVVLYAHLQKGSIPAAVAKAGAQIDAGTVLGKAGNSGNSTGPHLHIHALQGTLPESGPLRPFVLKDAWAIENTLVVAEPRQGFWSKLTKRGIPEGSNFVSPAIRNPQWPELVHRAVPETKYQELVIAMWDNGFRPVWIDGYTISKPAPTRTFFDVVFRPSLGPAFEARHGLDGAEYQAEYDKWVKMKDYRLAHVDSYWSVARNRLCYAVIFAKEPGASQTAYHGRSKAEHQKQFDDLTGKHGFRPVSISVVPAGGERWYTAVYEHRDVGAWEARSTLSPAEYQTAFDVNAAAGKHLVYVNSYLHEGDQFFVGIWHESGKPGGAAHHLDNSEFEAMLKVQRKAGGYLRAVTGYQRGAGINWAAFWTA